MKRFSFYEEFSEMFLYIYVGLHEKCPLFLPDFSETLNSSTDFLKILVSNVMTVEAELFHAHRQTDMANLIVAFHSFVNAL
jgi:hypothetical protein